MADLSYIEENRKFVTASKLKDFLRSPYLFKIKYIDEVDLNEEKRHFVVGTAFHYLMEFGREKRLEKYYIDDWLVKTKIVEKIKEDLPTYEADLMKYQDEAKANLQEKIDSLKTENSKTKYKEILLMLWAEDIIDWIDLTQLRSVYFKNTDSSKIEITPAEGRDLIGMYESVIKEPIRDMWGVYDIEQTLEAKIGGMAIRGRPDRVVFYRHKWDEDVEITNEMRMPLSEIRDVLWGKSYEEQKKIIEDQGIKCIIRDFKTTGDLSKILKELDFNWDTRYWYMISMSFYFTLVFALFWIVASVFLDVVEKKAPYPSSVISLPKWRLSKKYTGVIKPTLERMNKAIETDVFALPGDKEEIIRDPEMKKYYNYFPMAQEMPRNIDLDIG